MDKDIIEILYAQHKENNEKNVILGDAILLVYGHKDFIEKIRRYLDFFEKHLTKHFKNEDLLVDMLKRKTKLSGKEVSDIEEVKEEHTAMLDKYENLKKVIKTYNREDIKTRRNIFKGINSLVKEILKHAGKEDLVLFPVAREKLSQKQKNHLEDFIIK